MLSVVSAIQEAGEAYLVGLFEALDLYLFVSLNCAYL